MNESLWPALPLQSWIDTKETLHRYLQIVGKLRMSHMPKANHWWHITLYVTDTGISTGAMPSAGMTFEVAFDLIRHQLVITTSRGDRRSFELKDGLSVAAFYHNLAAILQDLGIPFDILAKPYDLSEGTPFDQCTHFHSYDKEAAHKAWQILSQVDMALKEFAGRSYSKTCPVHIYWHHLDLVVTRFSGARGPDMGDASQVEQEAYSHEVISFGFWFGDDTITDPAFYSYTYPSPAGIEKEPLLPAAARWQDSNGSPMALLMYDDIRHGDNPRQDILDFLESSYQAGAKLAGWNIEDLTV